MQKVTSSWFFLSTLCILYMNYLYPH